MTGWFTNLSIRSRFVLPIAAMMLVFAAFIMFFFPSRQRTASPSSSRFEFVHYLEAREEEGRAAAGTVEAFLATPSRSKWQN